MDKNKSVADFMNSFLNTPEPKIDNEYYEIEEQYFGNSVMVSQGKCCLIAFQRNKLNKP